MISSSSIIANAQMLITKTADAATEGHEPHPSAMLELRSNNQGFLIPRAALTSITDTSTIQNPVEGTAVVCTTTKADYPALPNTTPTLAVWDGSRWLFSYLRENVQLDLDKVRNFIFQNRDTDAKTFTTFPTTSPEFTEGSGLTGWEILIESNNSPVAQRPSFEFDHDDAIQKLIVDVEGVATVNNGDNVYFGYAVGIFVEDRLVNTQKFYAVSQAGACAFHKYNIRSILDGTTTLGTQVLNKQAGQTYNVKVGVRPLQKGESGEGSFSRLVFGNQAGNIQGTNTACGNLNFGTARSYMNVLTVEQHTIGAP